MALGIASQVLIEKPTAASAAVEDVASKASSVRLLLVRLLASVVFKTNKTNN
jgi:hypothetical protein